MISIMRFTRAQQHPAVKTIEEMGSRSKTSCQYGMKIAQMTNCVSDCYCGASLTIMDI